MPRKMSVESEDRIIAKATQILESRLMYQDKPFMDSPEAVKQFLKMRLGFEKNELFMVMYMDNRHRVISADIEFRGTIDSASVHPRVIVQKALEHNAAAVIFAHNHPSGVAEPSQADIDITLKLRKILQVIDIRVLDHMIVTPLYLTSLAERGEI